MPAAPGSRLSSESLSLPIHLFSFHTSSSRASQFRFHGYFCLSHLPPPHRSALSPPPLLPAKASLALVALALWRYNQIAGAVSLARTKCARVTPRPRFSTRLSHTFLRFIFRNPLALALSLSHRLRAGESENPPYENSLLSLVCRSRPPPSLS